MYSGTIPEITEQLQNVRNSSRFQSIPKKKQGDLNLLFADLKKETKSEAYKEKALTFLESLYSHEDFLKVYDDILNEVIQSLREDMRFIDFKLERSYVKTKIKLNELKKESPENASEIQKIEKELENRQKKLVAHRWMKKKFDKYQTIDAVKNPDEFVSAFKKVEADKAFEFYENEDGKDENKEGEKNVKKINLYLEAQIIDFYYRKSLKEVNPDKFELRYIDKI